MADHSAERPPTEPTDKSVFSAGARRVQRSSKYFYLILKILSLFLQQNDKILSKNH
jgi:hypothetical protein